MSSTTAAADLMDVLKNKPNEKRMRMDENPNPDFPMQKLQKMRVGDSAVVEYMKNRLQPENVVLDVKPIAWSDGRQVVNQYECITCHKTFPNHRALGGHRSSHYVKDENDTKQGDHICKLCNKSFPTGRALGGHKRAHYQGPLLIKRKAPYATNCSMPVYTENSPTQSDCVKLFGVDLKKLSQHVQEDKPISTTTRLLPTSKINSPSKSDCGKLFAFTKLSQAHKDDKEINLDLTL